MTATTITNGKVANGTLPPGWRTVRFGEMADSITDRVDDPAEAGVEYYVGLEHLDPESLKIRRWGQPTDVEATKLRFKPGDIIFGRRRAYQRKLAVAEFEGICSAHALVLRARKDVVLPEFLPFFMQSDVFFERAMSVSVGSLSPTINWKTLAQQEFVLPPREEQRRIAEVLSVLEDSIDSWKNTRDCTRYLRQVTLNALISSKLDIRNPRKEAGNNPLVKRLSSVCARITDGTHQSPNFTSEGVPFLLVSNLSAGYVDWNVSKWISEETYKELTKRVRPEVGDVLYTVVGATYGVPVQVTWEQPFSFQRHVAIIKPKRDVVNSAYLTLFLESKLGKQQADLAAIGNAQPTITLASLGDFLIPVPGLKEQENIVEQIQVISKSLLLADRHIASLFQLKKKLLGELLHL